MASVSKLQGFKVMDVDELFQDFSKKERKDYTSWNENELETFRNIIIEQNINCPLDDMFLLSFLRARKFERERALKLLKNYLSSRQKNQDVFGDYSPLAMKKYLDMKVHGYFTHTDDEGRIMGIGRCPYWDSSKMSFKLIIKGLLLFLDAGLTGHLLQVNGFVLILDAKTLSWRHLLHLTPSTIHAIISLLFQSLPVRFKAIHIVNIGKFVHAFYMAFYPFVPYKIKKRIHLHSSGIESLHKYIDPRHLPADYGGELPPFDPTECNKNLMKFQEFFENRQKYYSVV
ncbi:clavesin-2-like isoform X1 [Centruroides sculpturatus]|uniref:clavesin-2-like isoform X1 n=3 Tax=Centruroides sculpturatus TaxID=218467 RepID=UPI000C6EC1A5|nr:clavesin-2-like isoform X1 [Centruroides sculpturatus]